MSGIRGLFLGIAGLSLAELVVSNKTANQNTGAGITLLSDGLARWLNPNTALIPDLRTAAPATPAAPAAVGVPAPAGAVPVSIATLPVGAPVGVVTSVNV